MLLLVTVLFSLAALYNGQPAVCPDICNTTSANTCLTYSQGFNGVGAGTACWFNIVITNPGSFSGGFKFTNQVLTVNSNPISLGDDTMNLNSGSSASTSYTGGGWSTTAGTGCGTVFLGGQVVTGPLAAGTTFKWCGVFQSNTPFASALQYSIGAACYPNPPFPGSNTNGLGVLASDGCPSTSLPAGACCLDFRLLSGC